MIKRRISSGHEATVISFTDAIELIMVLPGKIAKTLRANFVKIICQYMSRDPVLKDQIGSFTKVNTSIWVELS